MKTITNILAVIGLVAILYLLHPIINQVIGQGGSLVNQVNLSNQAQPQQAEIIFIISTPPAAPTPAAPLPSHPMPTPITPGELANCAYAQSMGLPAERHCPADAAIQLGGGR